MICKNIGLQIIFFTLVAILYHQAALAQQQLDVKKIKLGYLGLPPATDNRIAHPVAKIEILDARPDSFCLGFTDMKRFLGKKSKDPLGNYVALTFHNSLEREITQNILPENLLQKDGYNFLLVIKELWLYDNDNPLIGGVETKTGFSSNGLLFRADIYLNRNGTYIPLFQIDSDYVQHKFSFNPKDDILNMAFSDLHKK